jgi:plasmid stabilization system protein ParE
VREVFWSASSLDDLISIVEWIAGDNPKAALDVIECIEAAGEALGFMATGRKGRVSGTYEKPVAGLPWIMAYAIEVLADGRERIAILRVIHGSRDWPQGKWPGFG